MKHVTVICFRHGGTHLIFPFIQQMSTLPIVEAGKLHELAHTPDGPVVVIWRDPRNRIVSTYRWNLKRRPDRVKRWGATDDERLAALISKPDMPNLPRMKEAQGVSYTVAMRKFVGHWMKYGATTTFEALTDPHRSSMAAETVAEAVGYWGDAKRALENVMGKSHTYTGKFSDWREWFGPKSIEAWEREGGPELCRMMGYE